ncbi:recombinase family protein [Pseudalkalibacillus sp. A8]|uniref:recombinase family protein n=1 Tax=Pseudalkalibacillus sp. A8 TaxID=3382641 RepID=UPI0038B556FA
MIKGEIYLLIGYARVSSTGQNLDRQIQELKNYGCEHIVIERSIERPEFEKLMQQIRFKDVIVCHDLTRFGRSQIHILKVIQELRSKKAGLVTLKERIDTREDNPYSDIVFSIFFATAEFERLMIKERQWEGIEITKKKGTYYHTNAKGKRKVLYDKVVEMLNQEVSVMDIHKATGLARNTIYKIKREIKSESIPLHSSGDEMMLEELDLPTKIFFSLKRYGIKTVNDLIHIGIENLQKIPGIGQKSVREIESKLKNIDLRNE